MITSANDTLALVKRSLYLYIQKIKTIAYGRPLLKYASSVWEP